MNTIMLCLEKMDIGGVETSTINQALEYKKIGYNVIVLAKEGLYSDYLKQNNITFIPFEFKLENNFNLEKANQIVEIIKKYNVNEVIVNQFPCILSILPACYITSIPYIAYVHTANKTIEDNDLNVYNWYEKCYSLYSELFNLYYNNAKKVVAISEDAANYVIKRYNVSKDKVIIIHNSINLDLYKLNSENVTNKKEKFLIISRIAEEKMKSIKNSIEFFRKYDNPNKSLDIVGDGEKIEELKEYTKNDSSIKLLGASNDIKNVIEKHDVILGLDRVLLETITMKKIAIVAGYDNLKGIITKDNIQTEAEEGFSGEKLKDVSINEIVDKLKNENIDVEYNYNYLKDNLNIENNIYIEKDDYNKNYDVKSLFEFIQKIQSKNIETNYEIIKCNQYANELNNNINELKAEISESDKNLKRLILEKDNTDTQLVKIENELNSVYNSKRFKLVNFIANKISKIIKH